ncbi:SsrA-binding protein SmpB [Vibrio crassostreae]|uniref:SsrA-binding protein SmpB n=1 Tax=Vibrio crassostreae TaxID=246167 RepID=UPI001B306A64
MKKKNKKLDTTIAQNRSARHEYFISDEIECGLSLEGWEVKALRAGKARIAESYVFVKDGEMFISNANFTPTEQASTHKSAEPTRVRKLLLKKSEIERFQGRVAREGYTIIATTLYWKGAWAKIKIGLGKGKKLHDKRISDKDASWKREQGRILKNSQR